MQLSVACVGFLFICMCMCVRINEWMNESIFLLPAHQLIRSPFNLISHSHSISFLGLLKPPFCSKWVVGWQTEPSITSAYWGLCSLRIIEPSLNVLSSPGSTSTDCHHNSFTPLMIRFRALEALHTRSCIAGAILVAAQQSQLLLLP